MNIDEHERKATAIERSIAKLLPGDYEMIIEGCMLAGTHWFNIMLHTRGIAGPDHDAMHAEFMSMADRRKVRLLAPDMLHAMDEIEALRTTHVRGDMPGGEAAAARALGGLRVLRAGVGPA